MNVWFNMGLEEIGLARSLLRGKTPYSVEDSTMRPLVCPIALTGSQVCTVPLSVGNKGIFAAGEYVELPEVAQNFIKAFDNNEWVNPISFSLDVPESWVAPLVDKTEPLAV